MSFFSRIFGKNKDGSVPTPQEAMQKLQETCDMLSKKSDFLEKKIAAELQTAKKHGTKNKRMALAALKRKKRYEKQLQNIDGTLSTVEFQLEALQNAQSNKAVLDSMKTGAAALKKAHGNMNADDVHDLMDDIQDQQEVADEITSALSSGIGNQDFDEDDLLAELEELEQEELDEQLLDIPTASDLPQVPDQALPAASQPAKSKSKKEEDDELAELQMWAN